MSDSVRPHRRQPTRLHHPWDSPGKNTAVGCHFLLQCMKVKSESEVARSCLTLSNPMDCSLPGFSIHGVFQARVLEWGAIWFTIIAKMRLNFWFKLAIFVKGSLPRCLNCQNYLLMWKCEQLISAMVIDTTYLLVTFSRKYLSPLWYSSVQFSHSVVSDSLRAHGLQYTRLPCP